MSKIMDDNNKEQDPKNETNEKPKRETGAFREYFELIAETLIYVFFVMTFLLQSFVIPTGSMKDNILIGDHILVDKVAYSKSVAFLDFMLPQLKIKRGMIVTFKSPEDMEKEYVKRVIGLPGETIKVIDKQVYINGELLPEDYTFFRDPNIQQSKRDNFPEYAYFHDPEVRRCIQRNPKDNSLEFKIPENSYFCMGDNRDNSSDSRYWGFVPGDFIVGKPWRVYWSYESSTKEYLTENAWEKVKYIFDTLIHFIPRTRWGRTFRYIK